MPLLTMVSWKPVGWSSHSQTSTARRSLTISLEENTSPLEYPCKTGEACCCQFILPIPAAQRLFPESELDMLKFSRFTYLEINIYQN
ncbi:hypothetical protein LIER_17786 [Lithospermum erythrorhizon]|uniref:Uncharacterized protein n=1 Tax=Lithospermum erythrorhizon TaxID=34254 RepID=A0AAV3QG14_LITER